MGFWDLDDMRMHIPGVSGCQTFHKVSSWYLRANNLVILVLISSSFIVVVLLPFFFFFLSSFLQFYHLKTHSYQSLKPTETSKPSTKDLELITL